MDWGVWGNWEAWTWQHWAVVVPAALVVLVIVAVVLGKKNHQRIRRKVYDKYPDLASTQELLLAYVRDKSSDQGEQVPLIKFWREHKIRGTRQYFVVQPLLEAKVLKIAEPKKKTTSTPPESRDAVEAFLNGVGLILEQFVAATYGVVARWCTHTFCVAPYAVVLSDRDWVRMVHGGVSAHRIMIERVENLMNIDSGGGDVQAMQAGRDVSGSSQRINRVNSSEQFKLLEQLHAALLADARRAPEHDAGRVRGLANELEEVLGSEDAVQDERLHPLLQRIQGATGFMGSMMASTAEILGSLKGFGLGA
jgi:hypothetical protein